MKNIFLTSSAVLLGLAVASPAQAVTVVGPAATEGSCALVPFTGITPIECAGGYTGNLIAGNVSDATGLSALAALGVSSGIWSEKLPSLSGNEINFSTLLTGLTVIGIHYGGGSRLGNATSFFKFNAGTGVDSFTFDINGLSNAAVFSTGGDVPDPQGSVPEPATWAMMMLGFGAVGAMLRRRKSVPTQLRVRFS